MSTMNKNAGNNGTAGLRLAIDYAPLLIFFLVNFLAPQALTMKLVSSFSHSLSDLDQMSALVVSRAIVATAAFMLATVVALIVSRMKLGSISPMLWISGALVLVFGGLTIYFHDPKFIQMKPTFVYTVFAAILGFGLVTGKPLLEQLLGTAYPGLSPLGWQKVTRNWALFFLGMAILNELVWRSTSFDFWTAFKLWGAIPMTFIFALANVPMMMKHGLMSEVGDAAAKELPPE
ncbi:MAG TPA: inner membrane-spanning protein YciB [Sphingomonas sp.]|nr:inner membrane-spanning protein YciB [Sphingomonas sp.]